MIDKVIKLKDGNEFSVIDQIMEKGKLYVFAVQVDNQRELLSNNFIIAQAKYQDGAMFLDNVDESDYERISNMFYERQKNNEKQDKN